MFYKVMKNNKVIDVLDHLTYLKWQSKNKIMLLSGEGEAQAILASNMNTIFHVRGLYDLPVEAGEYETVDLIKIDRFEYDKLKMLNGLTSEEIIDNFVLSLLESNVI
jgi:hypothetical protein